MQRIIHHVNRVKAQPHHIRKQVAFGVATVVTGIVGLIWLSVSLATNSFAIQGSNFAESTDQNKPVEEVTADGSQVAGAAAAVQGSDNTPRIQIVNVNGTTPVATTTEDTRTTIPF